MNNLKNPLNLEETEGIKLSLFMPTHLADPDNRQDPIVFKNLLKDAEEQLKEFPEGTLSRVMSELSDMIKDNTFWNHGKGGLGILASAEDTKVFQMNYKVPASVKVGTTYHILPLLRHMQGSESAFVADISRDRVGFYRFDGTELKKIEPEGFETEFTDLFNDYDPDKDGHSGANFKGNVAPYHSGIAKPEEDRKEREKYFRYLDTAFDRIHQGHGLPVILAGTTENISAFRELAKGEFYVDEAIEKPVDSFKPNQIRDLVRDLVENRRKDKYRSDEDAASLALRENRAETDLAKIRKLAEEGRVGELLVNEEYILEDSQELDEIIRDLYRTGAVIKPMAYEEETRKDPYLAILRY